MEWKTVIGGQNAESSKDIPVSFAGRFSDATLDIKPQGISAQCWTLVNEGQDLKLVYS